MTRNLEVECLHTPCHTKGHICYVVKPKNQSQAVFTGDTLFIAGCGRFFEGTANQMYDNLYKKLGSLPNDTRVFCGHEYTYANLKFASTVDPNNQAVATKLEWSEKMRAERQPTVPSTIDQIPQNTLNLNTLYPEPEYRSGRIGNACYRRPSIPRVVLNNIGDEIKSDAIHDLLLNSESENYDDFDTRLGQNIDFMNDLNENVRDPDGLIADWEEAFLIKVNPFTANVRYVGREEKETNPFMRVDTATIQTRSGSTDPIKTMAHIRKEKDNFKNKARESQSRGKKS
ncbi:hypothetical protein J6590_026641 [Homalodisca vitripennis]|nr:hypothetical protein J6590_026641 [Homalodisca vitripennis]